MFSEEVNVRVFPPGLAPPPPPKRELKKHYSVSYFFSTPLKRYIFFKVSQYAEVSGLSKYFSIHVPPFMEMNIDIYKYTDSRSPTKVMPRLDVGYEKGGCLRLFPSTHSTYAMLKQVNQLNRKEIPSASLSA